MTRIALTLALSLCLFSGPALGAKTDVVLLKNGDRVTGEIVRQEAGILEFKTDTMGRIYIEWRFIAEVVSTKNHSVEAVDGSRWLGYLEKPEETGHIMVNTVRGPIDLSPAEVVSVWPVEATFWDKLDLDAALGFDYTKATDITNFSLAVDFQHNSDERLFDGSLRSDITSQSSGEDQHRYEMRFSLRTLLPQKRFRSFYAALERNDALGIDLRTYAGAGIGKYFVKTNRQFLSISGGVLATNEVPSNGNKETNLEALGTVTHRYFRFAEPERNLDTTFSIYPSITDWGRVRSELRTTFKLEFFSNLFWALEVYANYDSEPVSTDAEKTDYGIVTSLGWSN